MEFVLTCDIIEKVSLVKDLKYWDHIISYHIIWRGACLTTSVYYNSSIPYQHTPSLLSREKSFVAKTPDLHCSGNSAEASIDTDMFPTHRSWESEKTCRNSVCVCVGHGVPLSHLPDPATYTLSLTMMLANKISRKLCSKARSNHSSWIIHPHVVSC